MTRVVERKRGKKKFEKVAVRSRTEKAESNRGKVERSPPSSGGEKVIIWRESKKQSGSVASDIQAKRNRTASGPKRRVRGVGG